MAFTDRPIEFAMTQWSGGERYSRPRETREMAVRLAKWPGSPETCQSCSSLPAVVVRGGMPLCGRCRENLETRRVWRATSYVTERGDDDVGTSTALRGLAIVTNSMSVDLGGFREVIRPSALDRFTNEKPDLRVLWSHDHSSPISRASAGTLRARVTGKGLLVEFDAPRGAAHYVDLVSLRVVTQQSFGFYVVEDEWLAADDSTILREVLDMAILETSPVAWPAYPATTLEVVRANKRDEWYKEAKTAERLRLAR